MTKEPVQTDDAAQGGGGYENQKPSLKERAVDEAKKFLGIFLYLWIILGLFVLHKEIVLASHDISYTEYGVAFINALILAKVMLVADDLHLGRGLEERPLVYPIVYKSVLFAIVLVAFFYVEKVIEGLLRGKTVSESLPRFGNGSLGEVLIVALIVAVSLIPFFAFAEFGRVIGERELRSLLFRPRTDAGAQALSMRHPAP